MPNGASHYEPMTGKLANGGSRDLVSRFESKYVIPRSLIPEIRAYIAPFCKPDPYAKGNPPHYTINTLQLDTPTMSLHHAKEEERDQRFKLRVRTYGREVGSSPVFAEIKAKFERQIVKTRTVIPFTAWNRSLVYGTRVPNIFRNDRQMVDFLQFRRVVWETAARPVLLVRYDRISYIGTVDAYARVTFDTRLEYQRTDSWDDFGRSGVWRTMDSSVAQGFNLPYSGVILEIKTLSYVPVWVQELVQRFELRQFGNSKYSTGIWRDGAFARYPSTNAAQGELFASA